MVNPLFCKICKRELNQIDKPDTRDCGGDCLRCMARIAKDVDCILEMKKLNRKD